MMMMMMMMMMLMMMIVHTPVDVFDYQITGFNIQSLTIMYYILFEHSLFDGQILILISL